MTTSQARLTTLPRLMLLACALGATLPASAQILNDSAAPTQATSDIASDPVSSEPSFSQITRVFDNWSVQCRERSGEGKCFVETVVRQSKPEVRDVIVLRFSQGESGIEAAIVTPNRVKLDKGVVLSVGDSTMVAPYAICGPGNCNAVLQGDANLIEQLRSQEQLSVSFYVFAPAENGGEREIKIPVALAGFVTSFDHLLVFDAAQ